MLLIVLKKIFLKLMINSAYGKTMENLQKRFKESKSIYVGFIALELSKWLEYDFHYSFIKKTL